jgi:hypothetical protein
LAAVSFRNPFLLCLSLSLVHSNPASKGNAVRQVSTELQSHPAAPSCTLPTVSPEERLVFDLLGYA